MKSPHAVLISICDAKKIGFARLTRLTDTYARPSIHKCRALSKCCFIYICICSLDLQGGGRAREGEEERERERRRETEGGEGVVHTHLGDKHQRCMV